MFDPIAHWLGDGDMTDEIQSVKDYTLEEKLNTIAYARGIDGRQAFMFASASKIGLADLTDKADFQTQALAVSLWYRPKYIGIPVIFSVDSLAAVDATDNAALRIAHGTNGTSNYLLYFDSESGALSVSRKTSNRPGHGFGDWLHLLVSRSATHVYSGYLNGELLFNSPPSAATAPAPGSNAIPIIGGYGASGANHLDGLVQSVMYWSKGLTDAEQQAVVRSAGVKVVS